MVEIIDFLLIFWASLGLVVFVFGKVYETNVSEQLKRRKDQRSRQQAKPNTTNLDDFGDWRTSGKYFSGQFEESNHYQRTAPGQASNESNHYYQRHLGSTSNWNDDVALSSTRIMQQQQQATGQLAQRPSYSQGRQTDPYEGLQQDPLDARGEHRLTSGKMPPPPQSVCGSIPTATGYNADNVDWVNSILYLFYTQAHKYGPLIAESVYRSLNEKLSNITHSSGEYAQLVIEFTGINLSESSRPELTNVRTEMESDQLISACCKIYFKRVSLDLSVQQLYRGIGSDGATTASELQADFFGHQRPCEYELVLENFEGKLKCTAMLEDKLFVVQPMEKPDTKILLKPLLASDSRPRQQSKLISDDTLVQIILQALTQVVVDLYFGDDVDFPQFNNHLNNRPATIRNKLSNILRLGTGGSNGGHLRRQIKQDFFAHLVGAQSTSDKRVLVKIMRANNINYNQNVTCLVELDAPRQNTLSSTKAASSNPSWNEHFLFQLSDKTRELTVELWDSLNKAQLEEANQAAASVTTKKTNRKQAPDLSSRLELLTGAKFLGRARLALSLAELRRNPVQRLSLPLEPIGSPGDLSNSVGGELVLELLYLDNMSASPSPSPSPSPSATSGPLAPIRKSTSASSLSKWSYAPGDLISVDRKLTPSGYLITTTTITKPAGKRGRPIARAAEQQQATVTSELEDSAAPGKRQRPDSPAAVSGTTCDARSEGPAESLATRSSGGRVRARARSRSLLRALKKRFSFARSRSLGPADVDIATDDEAQHLEARARSGSVTPASRRSIETTPDYYGDRARTKGAMSASNNGDSRARSVPIRRDSSEVPTIVINKARLSDTASALTYAVPKSQLVVEVQEPSLERQLGGSGAQIMQTRHYAVPDSAVGERKWSRRGVKLHLINGHQFVACHLAGSSICHLCEKVFSRRPGKQGYKCRNCHLLSHKQCHVKVDHSCPYAAGNELALEYIDADPPIGLSNELAGAATSGSSAGQRGEHRRSISSRSHQGAGAERRSMMAKSISLETGSN